MVPGGINSSAWLSLFVDWKFEVVSADFASAEWGMSMGAAELGPIKTNLSPSGIMTIPLLVNAIWRSCLASRLLVAEEWNVKGESSVCGCCSTVQLQRLWKMESTERKFAFSRMMVGVVPV